MEASKEDIYRLKCSLKNILMEMNGEASMKELKKAFIARFGKINLQLYGVSHLSDFLKKFPSIFTVFSKNKELWISLYNHPSAKGDLMVKGALKVMDRFLADCSQFVPKKKDKGNFQLEWDETFEVDNLTPTHINGHLKENNPFLGEILQHSHQESENKKLQEDQTDPFKDFHNVSKTLKVQDFPYKVRAYTLNESTDDFEHSSAATNYKELATLIKTEKSNNSPTYQHMSLMDYFEETLEVKYDEEFDQLEAVRDMQTIPNVAKKTDITGSIESLSSLAENKKYIAKGLDFESYDDEKFEYISAKSKIIFDDNINYMYQPKYNHNATIDTPVKPPLDRNFSNTIIYFSQTDSPTHFWFQTSEVKKKLEALNREIKIAYMALNDDELEISRQNLKKNLIVMSWHPTLHNWYRAKVTKVFGKYAHVFYIDYGTADVNRIDNLKYLIMEFLECPALCYRGRVYGVEPFNNDGFTIVQKDEFVTKVSEMSFESECKYYDENHDVYEMKLKFTGEEDKDICDWLFEGICKPIPDIVLKNRQMEKCPLQIVPEAASDKMVIDPIYYSLSSFDLLESGKYPSFETLIGYDCEGINFNTLFKTNYFHAIQHTTPDVKCILKKINCFKNIKRNFSLHK